MDGAQCSSKGDKKKCHSIYTNDYNETTGLSIFTGLKKMLFRWKKSVFKLIWGELLIFSGLYALFAALYQGLLCNLIDPKWRQIFELICIAAYNEINKVPIALMLGFYVRQVVGRWWDQFLSLPRPDRIALKLVNVIPPIVSLNFCAIMQYFLSAPSLKIMYLKCINFNFSILSLSSKFVQLRITCQVTLVSGSQKLVIIFCHHNQICTNWGIAVNR